MRTVIVDDDELLVSTMLEGLRRVEIEAEACFTAEAALERLARGGVDVVLLDVQLPGVDGISLCREVAQRWPALDVIVMSSHSTLDRAMAAVRAGAHDFLTKPFSANSFALRVARIREERTHRRELAELRALVGGEAFTELLGTSPAMQRVRAVLQRLSGSDASVLIAGESGTGKEIVARELHRHGRRAGGPFVAINCAALPEALLESELFGHVRGAFTDARTDRSGLFAQASGGTIFLDEVGELPAALQPKLLRALEEHTIRPVGGGREIQIDVRVIAATHRNLAEDIKSGRFRADLYYRLNVLRVALPALRDRGDDVVLLARRFATRAAERERKEIRGLSDAAMQSLRRREWPGNVRELRNVIDHAVAMCTGELIEVEDFPDAAEVAGAPAEPDASAATPEGPPAAAPADNDWPTLDEMERRYIGRVLSRVSENRSAAARILGIDRRTLLRKLAKLPRPGAISAPSSSGRARSRSA